MSDTSAGGGSTAPRTLVLASGNPGKLKELRAMLRGLGWEVRPQDDWNVPAAVEDGLTFVENALLKARQAARCTGRAALGDDSGLVVDALGGAPGILSARYAGPASDDAANNRKLLAALRDVPAGRREAHFYCALALVRNATDPAPLIATGRWHGRIATSPRGAGGFGYDPLFLPDGESGTAAELEAAVKNRVSHRGLALAALLEQLEKESFG
jgi:XTP/dITP diphosphohydrolase